MSSVSGAPAPSGFQGDAAPDATTTPSTRTTARAWAATGVTETPAASSPAATVYAVVPGANAGDSAPAETERSASDASLDGTTGVPPPPVPPPPPPQAATTRNRKLV